MKGVSDKDDTLAAGFESENGVGEELLGDVGIDGRERVVETDYVGIGV